jgi:hypothetical protein
MSKMKYLKYLEIMMIAVIGAVICSCNSTEFFEREQYKNVVALLSDDGYNIFTEEHDLGSIEITGYVSAVCGGSFPIEKDIDITVVRDEDLLLRYNQSNFELDEEQYAHLLSPDKYDIEDFNINIPSGQRRGLMAITLRPNGLSPDSVYFIPLRADRFTAYKMNPEKSTVLYRVMIKNYRIRRLGRC